MTLELMKFPNILGLLKRKDQPQRQYNAATINRLTSDWITSGLSADAELYKSLKLLRNRSRELCINNDYARRFLKRTSTNVIGNSGIRLQVRAVIASGLDISYATLVNDLENVNFSSIRHGNLEDRDSWRMLQNWMIEHFCNPIFENWLLMAITKNKIPIPINEFDKFNQPIWRPRGWAWVDPLKDNHANQIAIDQKTRSRSQIVADQGIDIEELFKQIVFEEELAKKYGLNLNKEQENNAGQDITNQEITNDKTDE
ncbi:phage portal protein [Rickettsia endosymbiont of Polydrusus tereticollis]|uniref:phage portal protein n=1 Tax=Rickettsia endosymbiont of Polydrusus tereticollis TaxID=3066251 RepID=UPI0031334034